MNKDDYINLQDNRPYTKCFQFSTNNVDFSKASYMGYWFYLIRQLTPNENAIWVIEKNKRRYANSINDLASICKVAQSTFYFFYSEAKQKNYIMKAEKGEEKDYKYVINPKYALNGNTMLKDLYILFNKIVPEEITIDKEDNYKWV